MKGVAEVIEGRFSLLMISFGYSIPKAGCACETISSSPTFAKGLSLVVVVIEIPVTKLVVHVVVMEVEKILVEVISVLGASKRSMMS